MVLCWSGFPIYFPTGAVTGAPRFPRGLLTFWMTVLYSLGTISVFDFTAVEEYSYLNWLCKEKKYKIEKRKIFF